MASIYMESLYNYTGEWINNLIDITKEKLQELEKKYSLNGMHDVIIADWEDVPFKISIYSNWFEIWEKIQLIEELSIEQGQIEMLEILGYDFLNMDRYDIESKLDEIYSINGIENDEDFAYEYYGQIYNLDKEIPTVFANAIDWEKLYRDLEIELTIHRVGDTYYYTY